MKDEEKRIFEKWFEEKKENCEVYGNGDDFWVDDEIKKFCLLGYEQGLKAGRPQWHDLRKDPNDLPIGEVFYWFDENPNLKDRKIYGRSIGYYNPYEKEWHGYYKGCPCRVHNVIAWCEIPTFDKE